MIENKIILPFILSISLFSAPLTCASVDYGTEKLEAIHSKLKLIHGNVLEEYPEQWMTASYLPSDAKVLELGGNIGRNSCVIASILEDSRNLVTMEPCQEYADRLKENRDCNGFQFHIEVAAVSKVPLVQSSWFTTPSEVDLPGHVSVDIISFDSLQKKYGIIFDTMVIDCEGALYYILRDDPKILKNIKLIIIENDGGNYSHLQHIRDLFEENGLQVVYDSNGVNAGHGFYQVWRK